MSKCQQTGTKDYKKNFIANQFFISRHRALQGFCEGKERGNERVMAKQTRNQIMFELI